MFKIGNLGICSVCGKRLEARPCRTCKGTGQVKAGLLITRACRACGGTGSVYLCPDSAQHLLRRQLLGGSATGASKIKSTNLTPPKPVRQKCPVCHGSRGVRHPMTGQGVPCPRCQGKGWI